MQIDLDDIEGYFLPRFEEDGTAAFDDKTVAELIRGLVARIRELEKRFVVTEDGGAK